MYKKFRNDLETGQKYEVLAQDQVMKYLDNKYSLVAMYDDYKYDMRYIYNNIINGDEDITIINDFIFILQKIQLGLLIFE